MKGVQCYELFGGIALKNHTFSFFFFSYRIAKYIQLAEDIIIIIIIIIMDIFKCYFSREHIALS